MIWWLLSFMLAVWLLADTNDGFMGICLCAVDKLGEIRGCIRYGVWRCIPANTLNSHTRIFLCFYLNNLMVVSCPSCWLCVWLLTSTNDGFVDNCLWAVDNRGQIRRCIRMFIPRQPRPAPCSLYWPRLSGSPGPSSISTPPCFHSCVCRWLVLAFTFCFIFTVRVSQVACSIINVARTSSFLQYLWYWCYHHAFRLLVVMLNTLVFVYELWNTCVSSWDKCCGDLKASGVALSVEYVWEYVASMSCQSQFWGSWHVFVFVSVVRAWVCSTPFQRGEKMNVCAIHEHKVLFGDHSILPLVIHRTTDRQHRLPPSCTGNGTCVHGTIYDARSDECEARWM